MKLSTRFCSGSVLHTPHHLPSPVVAAAVLEELVPADHAVPVAVHAREHLLHRLQPRPPLSLGPHQVIDGVCHLSRHFIRTNLMMIEFSEEKVYKLLDIIFPVASLLYVEEGEGNLIFLLLP